METRLFRLMALIFLISAVYIKTDGRHVYADEAGRLATDSEIITLEVGLSFTGRTAYKMIEEQPAPKHFYEHLQLGLLYTSPLFEIVLRGSMIGDGKVDGGDTQKYMGTIMEGRYLFMDEGYMAFDLGPVTSRVGRSYHQDEIENPYSLFISSNPYPALQANIRYETDNFFFENRWVSLNARSRNIYTGTDEFPKKDDGNDTGDNGQVFLLPEGDENDTGDNGQVFLLPEGDEFHGGVRWVDRGLLYRSYGLKLGAARFGFQESAVIMHRTFAPEYFFNPIPMYLVQILTDAPGRPWGEWANTGLRIGGFFEYEATDSSYTGQLLIDDVNLGFLPGIPEADTIFKLAWSLGKRKTTSWGTFGFYHAGASKYTFAATSARSSGAEGVYTERPWRQDQVPVYYSYRPYPYTYYPVSTYQLDGGGSMPLHYQDNYIGYKYGENNLAFMVDYQNTFFRGQPREFYLYANAEWVLNGAKSPSNPWHEETHYREIDQIIVLLDGTIEQIVRCSARVEKQFGSLTLHGDLTLGYIFNALKLEQPKGDQPTKQAYIFYPQKGVHKPLAIATIGGTWSLDNGL